MFSRLFRPDVEKLARRRDVHGLIGALRHEEGEIRLKALRALIVLQPEGLSDLLSEALDDEDDAVRAVAQAAGGAPREPDAERADEDEAPPLHLPPARPAAPPPERPGADPAELRLALRDPNPLIRSAAAEGLGALADAASEGALVAALSDPSPAVRVSAAGALDALPRTRATISALIEALEDADPSVRERAARSLGLLGDPTAVGPLLDALERGSPAAARALGEIGDPRALAPLLEALASTALCVAAAEALVRLGEPAALPALDALAEDPSATFAREAAARLRARRPR